MRTRLGLAAVLVATAACAGSQTQAPYGGGAWPPGQPPPAATPPPGPQAGAPGFPWWPFPTIKLPPAPPMLGVFQPIDVQALVGSLASSPCRPLEVTPGNWVGFDCVPIQADFVKRAVPMNLAGGSLPSGLLPAVVDHRVENSEGPVKSQGAVGTCTAMSLSTAMENALRRSGNAEAVSALHLWSRYRVPQMGEAGDSNIDKAVSAETVWPYDPKQACKLTERGYDSCGAAYGVSPGSADSDPAIVAARTQADASGRARLASVEKLDSHEPELVARLLAGGEDLWVAFNIDEDAWSRSGMTNGVIPDYTNTGSSGHAVVLAGYRTMGGQRQFLIHNSWGPSWGEQGYGWISERMVATQMRYGYRIHVDGTPGGLPSLPSAGGCAAGQARDAVTGQCVAACAGGGIPAGGVCLPPLPLPGGGSPFPGGPFPPFPGGGQVPPAPAPSSCPQGQAPDMLTGQCVNVCQGGVPSFGGLCVPGVH